MRRSTSSSWAAPGRQRAGERVRLGARPPRHADSLSLRLGGSNVRPGPNNDGRIRFKPEGLDALVLDQRQPRHPQRRHLRRRAREDQAVRRHLSRRRDARLPPPRRAGEQGRGDCRSASTAAEPSKVIDRIAGHTGRSGPQAAGSGKYAKAQKRAYFTTDLGDSGIRLIEHRHRVADGSSGPHPEDRRGTRS